jgi:RNA polymerase sigma factor (sigma-70 family)
MNLPISTGNDIVTKDNRTESDDLLVSAAKTGDTSAFVELSKHHSHKLLRRAYRITRNWQDAEDARQDALMKAFVHLKSFEERASFSSWLTQIAVNSALMILRKKRNHLEISIDDTTDQSGIFERWEIKAPDGDPESHYARCEREKQLRDAIQRLPRISREAVQLQYGREYSIKELAQTLGISVTALKSRRARARLALCRLLLARNWQTNRMSKAETA